VFSFVEPLEPEQLAQAMTCNNGQGHPKATSDASPDST
jgi:hypothetical protein